MPPLKTVVLFFGVALVGVFLDATSIARANSVSGDQERSGYVARGGVAFDATFSGDLAVRRASPVCPDCEWRTSGMCQISSPDEDVGFCGGIGASCPGERWLVKVWRRIGAGDWEYMGTWCAGDSGFATSGQVSQRVEFESWAFLPPLAIKVQPVNPVPVNVPVIAWVDQPRQFGPTDLMLGDVRVRLTAIPTWHWRFGSAGTTVSQEPGAPWPGGTIKHSFRRAGVRDVEVTAKWRAWWQIEDGPVVPVSAELEQRDSVSVDIREARALLRAR